MLKRLDVLSHKRNDTSSGRPSTRSVANQIMEAQDLNTVLEDNKVMRAIKLFTAVVSPYSRPSDAIVSQFRTF